MRSGNSPAATASFRFLHDVSLSVAEREIVVILGANGAGKSTLLRTFSGLIVATTGSARFDGQELLGQEFLQTCEGGDLSRSRGTRNLRRPISAR